MLLFITGLNAQKGGRTLHYTPKDGLSLGIVNSITQDEKGFIWFATADGLNRFDGTTFKVFKPEPGNKFSLAGNYVQSVFKDSEGIIWVSSRNGLNRYDEVKERFIKFSFPDRSNDITHISESVGRNLWISSGYGFYYFNKKSHRFINYTTANLPGLPSNYILNTFQDSHGLIWVGTQNAGVKAFQTRNKKLIPVNSIDASAISSLRINSVFEDHLQNIWITTSRGLVWYKRKDNRFFVFNADQYHLKSNVSLSLAEDQHQHLLIGLQDGGLYKLDLSTTQNTLPENFVFEQVKGEKDYNITPRSVQALFQDKDKNSWVGTYGGGVYMISKSKRMCMEIATCAFTECAWIVTVYYG
jgi:ligand-binding sensor domain-containing protein